MCRTLLSGSGAETSPEGDKETGPTPPQCIYPQELIKRNNRVEDCRAWWKFCVMSDVLHVFTQTGSSVGKSNASSLSAGLFVKQTFVPIGLSQNTAHWCPLPDCKSQCPHAKLNVKPVYSTHVHIPKHSYFIYTV